MTTKKKKPRSITFKFAPTPAGQAQANALLSALSGKPFPPTETKTEDKPKG